jgi:hypothetical protein
METAGLRAGASPPGLCSTEAEKFPGSEEGARGAGAGSGCTFLRVLASRGSPWCFTFFISELRRKYLEPVCMTKNGTGDLALMNERLKLTKERGKNKIHKRIGLFRNFCF